MNCAYKDLLLRIRKILASHVIIGDSAKIRAIAYQLNNTKVINNGRSSTGDSA